MLVERLRIVVADMSNAVASLPSGYPFFLVEAERVGRRPVWNARIDRAALVQGFAGSWFVGRLRGPLLDGVLAQFGFLGLERHQVSVECSLWRPIVGCELLRVFRPHGKPASEYILG